MKCFKIILLSTLLLCETLYSQSLGNYIKVIGTQNLNVRSTPGGTVLGSQPPGSQGKIIGGPMTASVGGTSYVWFNVDWQTGPDGWSIQDGMDLITPPAPTLVSPGNSSSPGPTFSNTSQIFSWNSVGTATSYGLYIRDVTTNTLYEYTINAPTTSSIQNLVAGHSYRWNMQAFNGSMGSSFSSTYYLIIQTAPATGTLSVNTIPVAGGIYVDGSYKGNGSWSGTVTVGSYSVSFGSFQGYNTPSSRAVTVNANQTTPVTGVYTPQNGSIRVSIVPQAAADAGAQWKLTTESSWHNSGEIKSELILGIYYVEFKSIPGWITPPNKEVTISIGNPDIWINSDPYTLQSSQTGTLTVTTTPVAGDIFVDGGYKGTGTWSGLVSTGIHTVSFGSVPGYTAPSGQTVTVNANQTTNVTGVYTFVIPTTRTLTVVSSNPNSGVAITVSPNDNSGQGNGATQFTRTYNNNTSVTLTAPVTVGSNSFQKWQKNGQDASNIQTFTVVMDADHTLTAIYASSSTGTLSITTVDLSSNPVAGDIFVDGSHKGTGSWSGMVVVGLHTVSFGSIPGYITPSNQSVAVNANQTMPVMVIGRYISQTVLAVRIDEVMVTKTELNSRGEGITRTRINLDATQFEVRQRQEIRFVCTVFNNGIDVSSQAQIQWLDGATLIGTGNDFGYTRLAPGEHDISVKATYNADRATDNMSRPITIIPHPEIYFPFAIDSWSIGGGNYYNEGSHVHSGKNDFLLLSEYATDWNLGSLADDWGKPVLAPISGTVKMASRDLHGFGNVVVIESSRPFLHQARVAHLSAIFIQPGLEEIPAGTIIGLTGGTGNYSPHIHFDMRYSTDGGSTWHAFLPEPIFGNAGELVQEISSNKSKLYGGRTENLNGYTNISEQSASISGGIPEPDNVWGFEHTGRKSNNNQTVAIYSLGNFDPGDRIQDLKFFVPYSRSEDEKNVPKEMVPEPPLVANAILKANGVELWTRDIYPRSKVKIPGQEWGRFVSLPLLSQGLPISSNNLVTLELRGNGLVFDEVSFKKIPAGSGGGEDERIYVMVERAYRDGSTVYADIYNPTSDPITLNKIQILELYGLVGDTLSVTSRTLSTTLQPDSEVTVSSPWLPLSDTTSVLIVVSGNNDVQDYALVETIEIDQAALVLDLNSISFGNVDTGALKDTIVTFNNTGSDTLRISDVTANNAVFTARPTNFKVPSGQSFSDTLRFIPVAGGPASGTFLIFSDAPTSPDTIRVSGLGITKTLVIPTDTSTVVFQTIDSTRVAITFQSGTVSGDTLTFESFGTTQPSSVQGIVPSDAPVLYFLIEMSIPDTATFEARVTLTYTDDQVAAAGVTQESRLSVAFFNLTMLTWSFVSTSLDTAANTVTFTTNHFSFWVLALESPIGIEDNHVFQFVLREFALMPNIPNPFNPSTQIAYEVPQQAHITLVVYNLLGQEVVRLVDAVQPPGRYQAVWHGRNAQGATVASGVYLYRLTSSTGFTQTRRMTLLK